MTPEETLDKLNAALAALATKPHITKAAPDDETLVRRIRDFCEHRDIPTNGILAITVQRNAPCAQPRV